MAATESATVPASLKKLGITRWLDLVLHFPLRYENESQVFFISQVIPGQFTQIQVRVVSSRVVFRPRRMLLIEVEDDTGSALLRFIYFKDAQKNAYTPGQKIRVLGEARKSLAGLEFIHPRLRSGWLDPGVIQGQPLVPVYPTTSGVSQVMLRRWVSRAIENAMPSEWLPDSILRSHGCLSLPDAIRLLHQPPASANDTGLLHQLMLREGPAWERIRFDELLAQQVALRWARQSKQHERALALKNMDAAFAVRSALPFQLTAAQDRVALEIAADLARQVPMQRLLQGDVGSGKTVIAALAAAQAVGAGQQVAVMAPTEILAEQLFHKFTDLLRPLKCTVAMLKGGIGAGQKREILESIRMGQVAVAVGTHALIQNDVEFSNLGLVIVDEQHRFGVGQRLALRSQGAKNPRNLQKTKPGSSAASTPSSAPVPHLLAMSATPIPRSLAMTYLADLDVSVLDERPPNRQPIVTKLMAASRREELLDRLKEFIQKGGQAYWVCPVIESSREEEARALQAIEDAEAWLRPAFGEQLQVLHGRLSADEKQMAMQSFAQGQKRLLLATTVIEVGVDVPKATLMVIEHAERFGLAQLHQLRGRIGRGAGQSTCILLFEEPLSDLAKERLKTLYETNDGFEVARRDLAIRGPGEFLGLKQSGLPSLRYSDLQKDAVLVERAVAFGAKLCSAAQSSGQLTAMGIDPEALNHLVNRWAFGKETLLASG